MTARLFVLVIGCALTLSACGDGGGDGDDEAAIRKMLTSAEAGEPSSCTRFSTLNFLEQTTKLEGDAAVEACEEQALNPEVEDPEKVVVAEVEVDGNIATAAVSFTGGSYHGQTVRLALAERQGRWKAHELVAFIHLDSDKLVTEMGRALLREMDSTREVEAAACVVRLLADMDAGELEELMLEYGSDRILGLVGACADRSSAL